MLLIQDSRSYSSGERDGKTYFKFYSSMCRSVWMAGVSSLYSFWTSSLFNFNQRADYLQICVLLWAAWFCAYYLVINKPKLDLRNEWSLANEILVQ